MKNREKRDWKKMSKCVDKIKLPNTCVIRVPQEKETDNEVKNCGEIMTEISKIVGKPTNLQIQKAKKTPSRINTKITTSTDIIPNC